MYTNKSAPTKTRTVPTLGAARLSKSQLNGGNHQYGAAALVHSPLFCGVSPADYAEILAAVSARTFKRGDQLYMEGDHIEEILLLTSGLVKNTKCGRQGAVAILGLSGPGDVLGAAQLLSTGIHTATATSVNSCRALSWRSDTFRAIMERLPVLYPNILRTHGEYLEELEDRFREVSTQIVSCRVARQVVRLHEKTGRPATVPAELFVTHCELAQMTGTTLFSISRLLSEWETMGIVTSRRHALTVHDVESLRALSDFA